MSYRHTGMIMCATAVDTAAERTRVLRISPVRSESPLLLKKVEQSLNTASARVHGDTRADAEIECCSTGGSRNQINAVLSTVRKSLTELLQPTVSLAFPPLACPACCRFRPVRPPTPSPSPSPLSCALLCFISGTFAGTWLCFVGGSVGQLAVCQATASNDAQRALVAFPLLRPCR
jgi:hypothetical protein